MSAESGPIWPARRWWAPYSVFSVSSEIASPGASASVALGSPASAALDPERREEVDLEVVDRLAQARRPPAGLRWSGSCRGSCCAATGTSRGGRARSGAPARRGCRRDAPDVPTKIDTTCSSTGIGEFSGCLSSSTRRWPRSSCAATPRRARNRTSRTPRARGTARGRASSVPATLFMALICAAPPDARHRDADVDRRAHTRLEQVVDQVDLAVGDRDDVRRDVRRHVARLRLDDRAARSAIRRPSASFSFAARSSRRLCR